MRTSAVGWEVAGVPVVREASNGRTIDVHVRRLRLKLAGLQGPAPTIVSARGHGYRLVPESSVTTVA